MNEKQRQLREKYVADNLDFYKETNQVQQAIKSSRLGIAKAQERLDELETKRFKRFEQYLQDLQDAAEEETIVATWHPRIEEPDNTEGWFLALTADNLPFLTHYINGWIPQVKMWMYIEMPKEAL